MASNISSKAISSSKVPEESVEIPNSGGARKSNLVTPGDTIQFLYEDTKTMWDVIQRGLKQSGNGPCLGRRDLASGYSWITYSQFIKKAENFGSGLLKLGLKPGQSSKIGIYSKNSVEWFVFEYGCWSQDAIIVPIYDTIGAENCTFIINQAEIELVVCDLESKIQSLIRRKQEIPNLQFIVSVTSVSQEIWDLAQEENIKLHLFSDIERLGELYPVQKLLPRPSDICMLCYTSGTTGEPKGAMVTHGNIVSAASVMKLIMDKTSFSKEDRMLSYLPMAHMFEQKVQTMAFLEGSSLGVFGGDVHFLEEDMRLLQPTFFPAVPRVLHKWYNKAIATWGGKLKEDLNNMKFKTQKECIIAQDIIKSIQDSFGGKVRLVITAAAPISKYVFEFYSKSLGYEMLEIYGLTETGGACTALLSNFDYKDSIGPPTPCCIMKLADIPEMEYFSKDSKGEICIKGHNVFKGYFKNPGNTSEVLDTDGWFHSGDVGMWLPNGTLRIIDRKKNILKLSQGEYLSPDKIENVYLASPYLAQIFVHGDSLESFLVAIVIPSKEYVLLQCKESFKNETWNNICKSALLKPLLFEDMQRKGKSAALNSFEQVKAIHIHPDAITSEVDLMTVTQKKKRAGWRKYFEKEIEDMYDAANETLKLSQNYNL